MHGREMDEYLRKHPTVLYRYRPNRPGLVLLLAMAAVAGGFSVATLLSDGMGGAWYWGTVIVLTAAAAILLGLVLYWAYYIHVHYVATSDRHLILGVGTQVVAIDWAKLDARSLDFGALDEDGQVKGVLRVRLSDYTCRLRLFSRYAVLENLHAFIATMLTRMQGDEELSDDPGAPD